MKFLILTVLLFAQSSFAKEVKKSGRSPSGVQCEVSYRDCVANINITQRANACARAVTACGNRLQGQDQTSYESLSTKCNEIEKNRKEYGKLAADFCRATLIQYIISN